MKGALEGIKVVECCNFVAGPYSAKLLADLGCEVVKAEKPGLGDEARRIGPFPGDIPHPERSGLFAYLNTNKLGITLNLDLAQGQKLLRQLLKKVDVFIDDTPPAVAQRRAIEYAAIKEENPRLIVISVTPFGSTGLYRDYKAYALNTYQSGGDGYVTPSGKNYLDRPPLKAGGYIAEYEVGIMAGLGTLAALLARDRLGYGQQVDISKQEVLVHMNSAELARYPNEGVLSTRATMGYPYAGIMECKDGYVQISLHEEAQWQGLVKIMGKPAWASDPRFKDHVSRSHYGRELNELLSQSLKQHTKQEIYDEGQKAGCTVVPYYDASEVVKSKQLETREFFKEIDHPQLGKVKFPSAPYKLSETPWAIRRPAPLLGEHNELVYCQWLGLSKEELVKLRQAGII